MSEVKTSEASTAKAQEKDGVLTAISSKTMSEVKTSKALAEKAQENDEVPASAEEVTVSEGSYSFMLFCSFLIQKYCFVIFFICADD
jgi:hypothetical protein